MLEILSGSVSVVLVDANVLEAPVALEVLNTLGGQQQKLFDLEITCIPQVTIVRGVFHQYLVSTNRAHPVVNAVPTASCFTLDVVHGGGMHHGARRPRRAGHAR